MFRQIDFFDGQTSPTVPVIVAIDITYTQATPGDWTISNPTFVNLALDELASRVKVNEGDISTLDTTTVKLTGTQNIGGNKTFDDDVIVTGDFTVNGLLTSINTTDLEVEDKNITVNKGGNDASSEGAGVTVERTGTDGSFVYENALFSKWKLGLLGSERQVQVVIIDTKANLDATPPDKGMICYASDEDLYYGSTGVVLISLGGSSGGGGGGLDIFHQEDFETTVAADLSDGNSATFLGGGVLNGTLTDETTNPLAALSSLRYVMGAASTNDYFASPVFNIDDKIAGNPCGMTLYGTYDGDAGDIKAVIYDVDNTAIISDVLDVIPGKSNPTRISVSVNVPTGVTQLRWGFQVVTGNSGKIFIVDDIEFSANPLIMKEISTDTDWATFPNTTTQGLGTLGTDELEWCYDGGDLLIRGRLQVGTPTVSEVRLDTPNGEIVDSAGGGLPKTCGKWWRYVNSGANQGGGICDDGNNYVTFSERSTTQNHIVSAGGTSMLDPNETMGVQLRVPIKGLKAKTENIVAATDSVPPVRYSGASGAAIATGTNTYLDFSNKQFDDDLLVSGFGGGNVTVTETGFFLTAKRRGYLKVNTQVSFVDADLDTSELLDVKIMQNNAAKATVDKEAIEASASTRVFPMPISSILEVEAGDIIEVQIFHNAGAAMTVLNTNTETFFEAHYVDKAILAGVPLSQVAYVKDVQSSSTAGGTFTSGSFQTRDLNTLEGETSFISLSANQFILQPGKYDLDGSAPAFFCDQHQTKLRNITDSTDDITGTSELAQDGANNSNQGRSFLKGTLNLIKATTFEVQHRCTITRLTNGFGVASSFGINETYTQLKITKRK